MKPRKVNSYSLGTVSGMFPWFPEFLSLYYWPGTSQKSGITSRTKYDCIQDTYVVFKPWPEVSVDRIGTSFSDHGMAS